MPIQREKLVCKIWNWKNLVGPGHHPAPNSSPRVPRFQTAIISALRIFVRLVYLFAIIISFEQMQIVKWKRMIKILNLSLTRPMSSLPAWTTTPRPMMLFSPFKESCGRSVSREISTSVICRPGRWTVTNESFDHAKPSPFHRVLWLSLKKQCHSIGCFPTIKTIGYNTRSFGQCNGWLLLKTFAIPSSPMDVSPKPLSFHWHQWLLSNH